MRRTAMRMRVAALSLFVVALAGALLVADSGRARSQGAGDGVVVTVSALSGNELEVEIDRSTLPERMEQGSRFRVTASTTNNAGVPLRDGEVTLHVHFDSIIVLDAEDGDIAGPSTRKLGTLNPGHTKIKRWNVRVDDVAPPGAYLVTVEATATLEGDPVSDSDSQLIIIDETTRRTAIASATTASGGGAASTPGPPTTPGASSGGRGGQATAGTPAPPAPAQLGVQIVDVTVIRDRVRGGGSGGAAGGADGPLLIVTASVANSGGASLDGVTVTLHFDRSGLALAGEATPGEATLSVGALEPDESARVRWELRVDEPGLYALTIEAATDGGDPPLSADDTAIARATR